MNILCISNFLFTSFSTCSKVNSIILSHCPYPGQMYVSAKILPAGNTHSIFERGVLALINNDFPRILTLLRKEQGFSQKKVAEDLGISQALLSHYEKGIRECGLNFVVKVADYYGVSCDYLLGRTPHRTGKNLLSMKFRTTALPRQKTTAPNWNTTAESL